MEDDEKGLYRCAADPASATWVSWHLENGALFNRHLGNLVTRRDGGRAIVRLQPHDGLMNFSGVVHGGALMTFIDVAMFIGARVLGCAGTEKGLTVDLGVQFAGGADMQRPVDAIVEVTRETGRMIFVRGAVEQEGDMISSFMGIIRKHGR